ncbi:unnamed protein product [Camellia sinensis]
MCSPKQHRPNQSIREEDSSHHQEAKGSRKQTSVLTNAYLILLIYEGAGRATVTMALFLFSIYVPHLYSTQLLFVCLRLLDYLVN